MSYGRPSVGNKQIVGAQQIIGNLSPQLGRAVAAEMGLAREVDPNAVLLADTGPGPRRRKILGAPAASQVAANASHTFVFRPQENFRPERLVFDSTNAPSFTITDILVATQSQLASRGSVPAEVFRPDAVDVDVHFETANVGNEIEVVVSNTSAGPLDLSCCFIGTSVR